MTSKNTITEINLIKGFAIILVFIGHAATGTFLPRPSMYEFIVQFIYAFHMPVFFLISGFLSYKMINMNLKTEYFTFLKNKFSRLIIPFITISFITNILIIVLKNLSGESISLNTILEMLKTIFLFPETGVMGALWFLYTLFMLNLIAPLIAKAPLKVVLTFTLIINIFMPKGIHFLAISRISFFLVYFFIGISIRKNYDNFKSSLNKNPIIIIVISIFTISIYALILSNGLTLNPIILSTYSFICGLLGSVLVSFIAYNLKNKKIIYYLDILGKYSMDIYLFSWFFQMSSMIAVIFIFKVDNYMIFFLSNMLIGSLCLPFSILIIRKVNLFNLLFLGINHKKYPNSNELLPI
ncbi:MAG: acyltransferase [Clostridium sp.]